MKTLTSEQSRHCDRLKDIIVTNGFAYDVSTTGAGKTIVSLKLSKALGLSVVVIGPPTLRNNWISEAKAEQVDLVFISNCNIKVPSDLSKKRLLVVDESHAFKNDSGRTDTLLRKKNLFPFVLFLSATPYDHPRQKTVFRKFVTYNCGNIFSRVRFEHRTKVSNYLCCLNQSEEDEALYQKGRASIGRANMIDDNGEVSFNPAVFNRGLLQVHESLMTPLEGLIDDYISKKTKLIVCLKFTAHFERLKQRYPEALILNGSSKMGDRAAIVSQFQTPSWKHKLILISAAVGGVGIDLDDQDGHYPRHILSLPVFISEYIQLVGRVQRRNTLSDAKSFVLQPRRSKTYFTHQLSVKKDTLKSFGCKIDFKKLVQHADNCNARLIYLACTTRLCSDISKKIISFSCSCRTGAL